MEREWLSINFARSLKPPADDRPPTMPFSAEEVDRILDACDRLANRKPWLRDKARRRARALILVLLYSGFRISDAVALRRTAMDLESGRLLVRIMKTGRPLYITLGEPARQALKGLPGESDYFFWSGKGSFATAKRNARQTVYRVMAKAGINGHPHQFRDTFSVRLLEAGEDIRTVQLLLGHTSLKTTENHYSPWVESMQGRLDTAVSKLDFGANPGTQKIRRLKCLESAAYKEKPPRSRLRGRKQPAPKRHALEGAGIRRRARLIYPLKRHIPVGARVLFFLHHGRQTAADTGNPRQEAFYLMRTNGKTLQKNPL